MKSVCFIIPEYNPSGDNNYVHQLHLATELAKSRPVFVIAEKGKTPKLPTEQQLQVIVLKSGSGFGRFWRRFQAIVKVRRQGCKIFYGHYTDASIIIASIIARLSGATTYSWHCVQEHYYTKPFKLFYLPEKIGRELPWRLSLRFCSKLVTCSQEMRRYYNKHYRVNLKKIVVIPNYVCLDQFKPLTGSKTALRSKLNLPKQKKILLFVHWMSPRKGADRLVEYARLIEQQKLPFFIVAIGQGPSLIEMKQQVKQEKLEEAITFLGGIANEKLPEYYQAADIFLLPSKVEEFGRVQLEAMATGLPIVATKTMSSRGVLSSLQRKLVVPQSQYLEVISLCKRLTRTNTLYAQVQQEGYERVRQYSMEEVVKLFEQSILA